MRENPKIVSLDPVMSAAAGVTPNAPVRHEMIEAMADTPELLRSLGFEHPYDLDEAELGRGGFARAFLSPSGKVLKLTVDPTDAMVSNAIADQGPIPGLVNVEAVYRMPAKVRERRSDPQPRSDLYAIVVERVRPLHRIWPPGEGLPPSVTPEQSEDLKVAADALATAVGPMTGMSRHRPLRPMQETLAKAMEEADRVGVGPHGMQYLHDLVRGWMWMADHGYRMGDLHTGNVGLAMDGRAVLLDLGMSADSATSAERAQEELGMAANPRGRVTLTELSPPAIAEVEQTEQGTIVEVGDHGIPLRFRVHPKRPPPTPEEHWKRPSPYGEGYVGGYYRWDPSIGPGQMLTRWRDYNAKVSTGLHESLELPTGESFQAILPADVLWRYREDDRPLHQHLVDSMRENGWLSPVLLQIGKNGAFKIGEGNHRLRVAKELGLDYVPVRLWFMQSVDTPTAASRAERAAGYARVVDEGKKARERKEDVRFYREDVGLKFNPSPRVDDVFDEAFDVIEERFPDFGTVEFYEDTRAGSDNGAGAERQYAYCKDGNPIAIAFAPKAADLPRAQLVGLMRHEFGHALEYRYGVKELERRLGRKLPLKVERRADVIAEAVWGEPIVYDDKLVQCVGVNGTRPRPAHLPDEKAKLKANPSEVYRLGAWAWDVDCAREVVRDGEPVSIPVPYQLLGLMRVDREYAEKHPRPDEPIIMASMGTPEGWSYLPIDGWHRIYHHHRRGTDIMSAYLLTPEETFRCLISGQEQYLSGAEEAEPGITKKLKPNAGRFYERDYLQQKYPKSGYEKWDAKRGGWVIGPVYHTQRSVSLRDDRPAFWAPYPRTKEFGKYVFEAKLRIRNPFTGSEREIDEVLGMMSEADQRALAEAIEVEPQYLAMHLEDKHDHGYWQHPAFLKAIEAAGFDGVMAHDPFGGDPEYVTFSNANVKVLRHGWADELAVNPPPAREFTAYHASVAGMPQKPTEFRSYRGMDYGPGFYLGTDPADLWHYGDRVYEATVRLTNPIVISHDQPPDGEVLGWLKRALRLGDEDLEDYVHPLVGVFALAGVLAETGEIDPRRLVAALQKRGYDGVYVDGDVVNEHQSMDLRGDYLTIFSPEQLLTWEEQSAERLRGHHGSRED